MEATKEHLHSLLISRLNDAGIPSHDILADALEVIIFGSTAAGMNHATSDLDVLVIGGVSRKHKSDDLDLLWIPTEETKRAQWLECELASHIARYGVWLKGTPAWTDNVSIGPFVIGHKRRRIISFLRKLPTAWESLEECFRIKYAKKLRRETQRLMHLENGLAVPPTQLLDKSLSPQLLTQINQRLMQLAKRPHDTFLQDLLRRQNSPANIA